MEATEWDMDLIAISEQDESSIDSSVLSKKKAVAGWVGRRASKDCRGH